MKVEFSYRNVGLGLTISSIVTSIAPPLPFKATFSINFESYVLNEPLNAPPNEPLFPLKEELYTDTS